MGRLTRNISALDAIPSTIPKTETANACPNTGDAGPGLSVLTGTLSPDTYPGTPQVSIAGKGILEFAAIVNKTADAKTFTVKLVLDQQYTIEHAYTIGVTLLQYGFAVVGGASYNGTDVNDRYFSYGHVPFWRSLDISIKCADAGTDEGAIQYVARYR